MKTLALALLLCAATPAFAATTSDQLDALAATIETAPGVNHAFDKQAVALLAEPMQTYAQKTLPDPSKAPYYTSSIDMVSNLLRPPGWNLSFQELPNTTTPGGPPALFVSSLSYWSATPDPIGLKWESAGSSKVNRANAIMTATLRAWAYILRQDNR